MNDLVAWLNAQIDTDERVARAARRGPWCYQDVESVGGGRVCDLTVAIATVHFDAEQVDQRIRRTLTEDEADATGRHMANWDPARVLAEVESKRRIVAECEADLRQRGDGALDGDVDRPTWDVLRLLTVAYRHRDGWQEEWAR